MRKCVQCSSMKESVEMSCFGRNGGISLGDSKFAGSVWQVMRVFFTRKRVAVCDKCMINLQREGLIFKIRDFNDEK